MDTMSAFLRGQSAAACGAKHKVFDWDKAARLIKEKNPRVASAGLSGDWEYTGGVIYTKEESIDAKEYTYLSSNWAIPELELDGITIDCYVSDTEEDNPNKWNDNTSWPQSALDILKG